MVAELAGPRSGSDARTTIVEPSLAIEFVRSLKARTSRLADLATQCMDRIAHRESIVHAWSYFDPIALRRELARVELMGDLPLKGVPIGIKDIFDTADMPTTYGSAIYEGHFPERDAELVARLRSAGALIAGKTVSTEFAYTNPGPTVNPHATAHTPGGSSSGSAAAVADGMVPIALGSQTGGSTIRPAAFCGIVGFKPTYGWISTTGMKPLAPSMDTIGILARSAADVALVLPVLSGQALASAGRSGAASLRVAWFPGPHRCDADADAQGVLESARGLLRSAGYEVEPIELAGADIAGLSEANRLIMAYEAARSLSEEYRWHRDEISAAMVLLIETGNQITAQEYRRALEQVARAREVVNRDLGDRLLMTFSAPGEAPRREAGTGNSLFNRAWTAMGLPCATLPLGRGSKFGLPLGVQFIAVSGADGALVRACMVIETLFNSFDDRHRERQEFISASGRQEQRGDGTL